MPRQGAGETVKTVHDEFWNAGGTGSQQNPFRRLGDSAFQGFVSGLLRDAVQHDVGFGAGAYQSELLGRQVRRAENHPTRDAVELEQRERGAKLLAHRQQHGSAAKGLEISAEYRACAQVLERNRAGAIVKHACNGTARRNGFPQGGHAGILAAPSDASATPGSILSKWLPSVIPCTASKPIPRVCRAASMLCSR